MLQVQLNLNPIPAVWRVPVTIDVVAVPTKTV